MKLHPLESPLKPSLSSDIFTYELSECYLFPRTLALSKLLSPYLQYFGIYSDRQQRQLIQVHTHFTHEPI